MLNAFHKLLILLSIVLVCHVWGMAQCPETNPNCNQVKNWVFGDSVWLYFADTGIVQRNFRINTREATSTINSENSDSLLYIGTPEVIYRKGGEIAFDSLKGHQSSVQGAMFIRLQGDSVLHYFSGGQFSGSYKIGLYHHRIINGEIFDNKTIVYPSTEQLASINHLNGQAVWLITHKAKSDSFFIFPLTSRGIECPNVIKIGGDYSKGEGTPYSNGIQIKVSPDGKKVLAFRSEGNFSGSYRVDLFKLNTESGILYDNIKIDFSAPFYSCFSPLGDKLYLSNARIYQYSLEKFNSVSIQDSETPITHTANYSKGEMSIAPDGRILIAYSDSTHLGVIDKPSLKGLACDLDEDGISLSHGMSRYGLPNFNASYFYTPAIDFAYTEDCWNHEYQFEGRDTLKATAFKWIFEKATVRDSILTKHCTYQFPDTGKWLVSHIASNGTRTDTVTKTLTIRTRWKQDMLGRDTFYCENDSIKLVLKAPENMHCVHWMGEEPNLDTAEGPILDYDHFHVDSMEVDTAGIYYVKVTNKTFCQTWDTITIVEGKMPNKPVVSDDSKELASTIESARYRWFLNDTFYFETSNRSFIPTENGYYQVQLLTEHGCESQLSDSFHYDKIGITPVVNNLPFKVYPNPSDGKITIEVEKSNTYLIEVYDLTGKQVVKQHLSAGNTIQTVTIDVKGTYLLKVSDNEGHHAQRLIEVR